jgi:hypothetical protein
MQKFCLRYCAMQHMSCLQRSGDRQLGKREARKGGKKDLQMIKNFDEIQQFSKDNVDTAMKAFGAVSKGAQAIAVEVADYSKKSFEEGTQAFEKLAGVKSVEKAIELQQAYLKDAYEGFVAKAAKIGELYTDLAKEAYKPYEGYIAKVTPVK